MQTKHISYQIDRIKKQRTLVSDLQENHSLTCELDKLMSKQTSLPYAFKKVLYDNLENLYVS